MDYKMLLVLIVVACTVQTTLGQCLGSKQSTDQKGLDQIERSQLDFSLNLFKAVSSIRPSDNVFISPVSVYNALLLAYFVSAGHTEDSLRNLLFKLKYQDKEDMLLAYRLQRIRSTFGYESQVKSANRLFVSLDQTITDCMYAYFEDDLQKVDFTARGISRTVDKINSWVANETYNQIHDIVSVDSINPMTQMILANAAYFKGVWQTQFDEIDTRMSDFHITKNKSVKVPMMYQQNSFSHWRSEKLTADILELPYKGSEVSLILILPDPSTAANPVQNLLKRMDSDTLLHIIKESTDPKNEDKVEVKLPKFSSERTLELTSILEGLGVGDLFRPTSNLTGLTGGPRIQLNSAIHKAKIQLDERGTEAAAVTALTDTRIPASTFVCDRPFLYLLHDKTRSILLFAGIYNDPTK